MKLGHRLAAFLYAHRRRFRLLIYSRGVPWHAVDDVFQETAMALMRAEARGLHHTGATPYNLVYTSVLFRALKYHRRCRRDAWLHGPMPEEQGVPGWAEERMGVAELLHMAEALPLRLRGAIDHIIDGGDAGTYAEHMEITPDQANILLVEARAYLRRKIPNHANTLVSAGAGRSRGERAAIARTATRAEHRG